MNSWKGNLVFYAVMHTVLGVTVSMIYLNSMIRLDRMIYLNDWWLIGSWGLVQVAWLMAMCFGFLVVWRRWLQATCPSSMLQRTPYRLALLPIALILCMPTCVVLVALLISPSHILRKVSGCLTIFSQIVDGGLLLEEIMLLWGSGGRHGDTQQCRLDNQASE